MGTHCSKPRGQRAGCEVVFTIEGAHDAQINAQLFLQSTGRDQTILCATKFTQEMLAPVCAMAVTVGGKCRQAGGILDRHIKYRQCNGTCAPSTPSDEHLLEGISLGKDEEHSISTLERSDIMATLKTSKRQKKYITTSKLKCCEIQSTSGIRSTI